MHELTGNIVNREFISFNAYGQPIVSIKFNEKLETLNMFNELKDNEKLTIKIGKFRQKRSLDANAYAWVLIGKIAEKTNARTQDVYRAAIKEVGGNSDVVCVKNEAVESLCRMWEKHGLGWQTDTFPSKIDGCTNVILYYGSSCYDTAQMHRLLEIILQDCAQLGIEVKSKEEVESLLNSWKE